MNKMAMPWNRLGSTTATSEANVKELSEAETRNLQPTYLNYARVVLDFLLVAALIIFVFAFAPSRHEASGNFFRSHQVPIYTKNDFDMRTLYDNAERDNSDDAAKIQAFKTSITAMCTAPVPDATVVTIDSHPMCVCILGSTALSQMRTCLLTEPMPSKYSDWNVASVSTALILWFLASLATSIGTLPFISRYNVTTIDGTYDTIHKWNKWIVISCAALTLLALSVPLFYSLIFFESDPLHVQSYFNLAMWSFISIAFCYVYNYKTVMVYWHCFKEGFESAEDNDEKVHFKITTIKNFFLYLHFLVAAPAIAMVLHLTQKWAEYHTIVNTTVILSTIFAVDGFAAEMSNYWNYRTSQREKHFIKNYPEKDNDGTEVATASNAARDKLKADHKADTARMHTRLGLIRLFAWVVNAVMLLLLLTLAYPVEVEGQKHNSAIFVVVVVTISGVFLFPDLIREFTDNIAWNSIQFRLYGDLLLRCLTFFFVWQASGGGQV